MQHLRNMGALFSKPSSCFVVHVTTGDRKKAGTDANVQLRLYDNESHTSEPIVLNQVFKNDFERGATNTFKVPKEKVETFEDNAIFTRIELWRDDAGLFSPWLVDTIRIENLSTQTSYMFPIFRWIKADVHYQISHLDTSLPQFDEFPEQRKNELEEKKKLYEYKPSLDGLPVQVKNIPEDEDFSFNYKWDILKLKIQLESRSKLKKLLAPEDFPDMEAIQKLYDNHLPPPEEVDGWKSDLYFGYQRIACHNPMVIELVTQIPDKLPVTDAMLGSLLEGVTLQEAIDQKRLFICDYHILEGIPTQENYAVCSPIGLFFVNKDSELMPVAIQLYQTPGDDNPIFTPDDPDMLWCMVKMWFNNADAAHHQGVSHIGSTHLIMEGVTIATHRMISQSHPIFKLLAPHFLYLIAINSKALALVTDNWVKENMNCGSDGLLEIMKRGYQAWNVNVDGDLPGDLASRGLSDPNVLPTFHYREDGLELYEALNKYVTSYVNLYYTSSELLREDSEIQNWARDLATDAESNGAGFKGVPANGEITSTDQLIKIVTSIIYICSVRHAAVNFPMYSQYCYPPNCPALLKGKPPTSKKADVTEKDIVHALPDRASTLTTMVVTKILSAKSTRSLGDFEVQYVHEPKARKTQDKFTDEMAKITQQINDRNKGRKNIYPFLNPVEVPNSISI